MKCQKMSALLVTLIIQLLRLLPRLHRGPFTVQEIQPLTLKQLVGFGARHGCKDFSGQLMLVFGTATFDGFHGFEGGGAGNQFVGPLGVVCLAAVDLVVSVFVVAESEHFWGGLVVVVAGCGWSGREGAGVC